MRWALQRAFVLAAWHRVQQPGRPDVGPRATDYFEREIPSFADLVTIRKWSEKASPRGSFQEGQDVGGTAVVQEIQKARKTLNARLCKPRFPAEGQAAHSQVSAAILPDAQGPPKDNQDRPKDIAGLVPEVGSQVVPPASEADGALAGQESAAILKVLEHLCFEVQESRMCLSRLEMRLGNVEKLVNPMY